MDSKKEYSLDLKVLSNIGENNGKLTYNGGEIGGDCDIKNVPLASNLIQFKGKSIKVIDALPGKVKTFNVFANDTRAVNIKEISIVESNGYSYDMAAIENIIKSNEDYGSAYSITDNSDGSMTITNLNNAFQYIYIDIPKGFEYLYYDIEFEDFTDHYTSSFGICKKGTSGPNSNYPIVYLNANTKDYNGKYNIPKDGNQYCMCIYGIADTNEYFKIKNFKISNKPLDESEKLYSKTTQIGLKDGSNFDFIGGETTQDEIDLIKGVLTKKVSLLDLDQIKSTSTKQIDKSNYITYVEMNSELYRSIAVNGVNIKSRVQGAMLSFIYNPLDLFTESIVLNRTASQIGDTFMNSSNIRSIYFELSEYETKQISQKIDTLNANVSMILCDVGDVELIANSKFDFSTTKQLENDHNQLKALVQNTIIPQTVDNAMNIVLTKYNIKQTLMKLGESADQSTTLK